MKTLTLRERQFRRILLIKPSAVGDVIHTVPVLVKLRGRYPDAQIDWLLTPAIAEFIGHHPALSNVVLFDRGALARLGKDWSAPGQLVGLMSALWKTGYDLVVDLHGQFRSALLALATRAPVRIGFDRPRQRAAGDRLLPRSAYRHGWTGTREGAWAVYSHRIPIPMLDVHAVDRYLWLGGLLGLPEGPPDFRVPVPAAARARIQALLAASVHPRQPVALLVPGTIWETKHWHVEGFAGVARHLARKGFDVVLAGSARERRRCHAVASLCPGAMDLSGKTSLSDLAALIERATICVTNDSGSMHLAVALERPVVSIFGPTDPIWIGPYGRPGAVVQAQLPCVPCYLRKLRACPHGHACMHQVSAAQVIERIDQVLQPRRAA